MAKAKTLKKEWYPIIAPKIFRNAVLGETVVYEPEKMVGKGLSQNLMTLTNDVKRQNIKINFEIVKVENGKAFADITGYEMVQSSVKRLVRRNINKMDLSFTCNTSDKKTIRIKPILITRSAASGSVATKIRKNAQELLIKHIGSMTYDNLINDLISHKLQSTLKANLNKIHPLRICEIRSMHIVKVQSPEAKEKEKTVKKKEVKQEIKVETKVEEKKAEKVEESKIVKEEINKDAKVEEKKPVQTA
ncbi:hypothetical protein CMO93_04105 [Candidatus Woesearchaeota archaeon]|nr:hypothetical protein [Candidatus Woesearchaeota archaeon]|tara:strand:+ start:2156 stop:2896 length:741 start_codon:yes stop_codon:yes gene_type:complete